MRTQIEVSNYMYILLMIMAFCCGTVFGQDFVSADDFDDKIAKDVVAVEFWAGWNSANEFAELVELKECEKYRIDINANSKLQSDFKVMSIPTIILFDNGVEKERFTANIMFQLEADKKTIQNSIDTITLNKFQ